MTDQSDSSLTFNTNYKDYVVSYDQELTVTDAEAIDALVVHNPCEIIVSYEAGAEYDFTWNCNETSVMLDTSELAITVSPSSVPNGCVDTSLFFNVYWMGIY